MSQAEAASGPSRSERTRSSILQEAERLFAERGFEATRLEDVAEAVGIRRASIVYYFRDKRELYDMVLGSVFGGFHARLESALGGTAPLPHRVEAAVSAWVEYVGERPALARLLLREVAGAPERGPALLDHIQPFVDLVRGFIAKLEPHETEALSPVEPAHFASTIAGATVFFVAAMPALLPDRGDPLKPEQLEAHRREMLGIARRLLGVRQTNTG